MTNFEFNILNDCRKLVKFTIDWCDKFPNLKYTLNQHILRTAISVGSNLAEGNKFKDHNRMRFFNIALGSIEEYEFQYSCYDFQDDTMIDLIDKIRRTIINLRKSSIEVRKS